MAGKATRDGFGAAIMELGETDPRVVVVSADLAESLRIIDFKERFPDRFFECGVAEQNMAGVASGLAYEGKIPFACSFGVFSPGTNWAQIRLTVCYSERNVKICASHTGLSTGEDGATHQALEDIACMRALPKMTVLAPCDYEEARRATLAAARYEGPVYLRFGRPAAPEVTAPDSTFEIGRANLLREGSDVAIIACGLMVQAALEAAESLAGQGVSAAVINCHTIKPLDRETLVGVARRCGCLVTAEEHQVHGGLGSAVAELLASEAPVPLEIVGVDDTFGESGAPAALLEKYGLTSQHIGQAAHRVMKRKP